MRYNQNMKNAILLHGWNTLAEFNDPAKPTASNDHWFPWLTKQLQLHGYKVDVPEMTQHTESTYESWVHEFERFDITPETLLVGHSCGGGFLVRYLSEHDISVGRVILVAPWIGIKADEYVRDFNESFFDFTISRDIASKTQGLYLMHSDDDMESVQLSVAKLRQSIDALNYLELKGKGHFTRGSLGTDAFPELFELCIKV